MENETDDTATVLVVPDSIVSQVLDFAAKLADEAESEVEGFAYKMPEILGMGDMLGRPGALTGGVNALSGTKCKASGFPKPNDFNCADDDT